MSFAAPLAIVAVAAWFTVSRLGERSLYVLYVFSCLQNFVVPYLYTTGFVGVNGSLVLILAKEILLFILFVYSLRALKASHFKWPVPLRIMIAFTVYCAARGFIAVLAGDQDGESLRVLREVCYPLQILTVSYVIGMARPLFCQKLLVRLMYLMGVIAIVGIIFLASFGTDFWKNYVNIASYNIEVKGEDPALQDVDSGVSSTGTGRADFSFLSSLRAMGTFGDPISMGFEMALPVLLFLFLYRRRKLTLTIAAVACLALFLTFTRSAWIYTASSALIFLIFRRRLKTLLVLATALVFLSVLVAPLTDFITSSASQFGDPEYQHSQGVIDFYRLGFTEPANIIGKGLKPEVQTIPESGYAFLLEHFGLAALVLFVAFHVSCFKYLMDGPPESVRLRQIAQAQCIGTLVVFHFSQYPFGFMVYLTIWFFLGLALALVTSRNVVIDISASATGVTTHWKGPELGYASS